VSGKKRTRRGGKNRRRGQQHSPGWHLKLAELRRTAKGEPGEFAVKQMRGWELHLRYVQSWRRCPAPECHWEGLRVVPVELAEPPCPECGGEGVRVEPWSLTAKPVSGTPEWGWLNKAADFLGIPALDAGGESQRPTEEDGLSVVLWTWDEPVPADVLPAPRGRS